jgi:citrate lyase subunit beta/citryl-CoA lyase
VRINPLDSGLADDDLAAVAAAGPDGIMLPKVDGPDDVLALARSLDALGSAASAIRILPVATETPVAPFALGDYAKHKIDRLLGLTWGAEDLSAALGASTNLAPEGGWAFTYRLVRSLTLLGAKAAGVQAIDTLYVDYRDEEGLRQSSRASRAEGFTGRLAIHPAQVEPINESYMPTAKEVEHSRRVVAAFADASGAGTIGLDGKMLDQPHLRQAEAVLELAAAFSNAVR